MRIYVFILATVFSIVGAEAYAPKRSHQSIRSELELRSLRFFIEEAHPDSGLVRDKANNFVPTPASNRVASIAATGFGLTVIANAAENGWLDRQAAYDQVLKTLRFSEKSLERYRGWFYHFVDWQTGTRVWNCEISTIDTALFVAGALYAGAVFPGTEVAETADRLFNDIDFHDFMTDGGTKPFKRTLSLSYKPEEGYAPHQWVAYSEQMILLILGLGHPSKPLPPESWQAWNRDLPVGRVGLPMGADVPLFIHQYSQAFIDFRGFKDGHRNYFTNSLEATRLHRQIAKTDIRFKTFKQGFWGLSAGESPTGYAVYSPAEYQGTVCIGCAIGSAMFMPNEVLTDASKWIKGPHATKIWGRYGFVDSIDIDRNWFSSDVLGITVGPAYMGLVNTRANTSVWQTFMKIPAIQRGLQRAQSR